MKKLIGLVLLLTLAACGGGGDDGRDEPTTCTASDCTRPS